MRSALLFLGGSLGTLGLALAAASVLVAQTVDGLDLAAVRARARLDPETAQAFEQVVARRGEAFRAEAAEVADKARAGQAQLAAARSPGAGVLGFDAMVAAASAAAAPDDRPRLIAFASLSMPQDSLRQMIADVTKAGGVVAFRGFPQNSAGRFTAALARVLPAGPVRASVGIDPRLFRAFGIEAVPAYVVTGAGFDLCDGFHCRTVVPPHDRIAGNVTLGFALATIAGGGGPGAGVARVYAERLEARP